MGLSRSLSTYLDGTFGFVGRSVHIPSISVLRISCEGWRFSSVVRQLPNKSLVQLQWVVGRGRNTKENRPGMVAHSGGRSRSISVLSLRHARST